MQMFVEPWIKHHAYGNYMDSDDGWMMDAYLLPVNSACPFLLKRNFESLYPQPFHFIISCLCVE